MATGGFGGYGQQQAARNLVATTHTVTSAGGSVTVNHRHPASNKPFVGTERQIAAAEHTLGQAEHALDEVCVHAETDTQVVQGFAAELLRLSEKLTALGGGAAMEEVESKLAVARAAVEKLGGCILVALSQPPAAELLCVCCPQAGRSCRRSRR